MHAERVHLVERHQIVPGARGRQRVHGGLYGEAGDDTLSVDVSAGGNVASITTDGGEGSDRLHITGEL